MVYTVVKTVDVVGTVTVESYDVVVTVNVAGCVVVDVVTVLRTRVIVEVTVVRTKAARKSAAVLSGGILDCRTCIGERCCDEREDGEGGAQREEHFVDVRV